MNFTALQTWKKKDLSSVRLSKMRKDLYLADDSKIGVTSFVKVALSNEP